MTKKYQLNHNIAYYNSDSGLYETKVGRNMTYEETLRSKWMCEKCLDTFPNFRGLLNHKKEYHSY
jgi:hypothetical protein